MISIVVVDDHAVVREGTRELLERHDGIEVIGEAGSAAEAIDAARRRVPTVMVVDVELPDMSGIDVVRAVAKSGLSTRCLMLSAHDHTVYVSEALAAGAAGYLLKTATSAELVEAVRSVGAGNVVIDGVLSRHLLGGRGRFGSNGGARVSLSARELDVLQLLVRGRSNKEVADDLDIGIRTVESYVSAILQKLGVRSRTEASLYAIAHHLVRLDGLK